MNCVCSELLISLKVQSIHFGPAPLHALPPRFATQPSGAFHLFKPSRLSKIKHDCRNVASESNIGRGDGSGIKQILKCFFSGFALTLGESLSGIANDHAVVGGLVATSVEADDDLHVDFVREEDAAFV